MYKRFFIANRFRQEDSEYTAKILGIAPHAAVIDNNHYFWLEAFPGDIKNDKAYSTFFNCNKLSECRSYGAVTNTAAPLEA